MKIKQLLLTILLVASMLFGFSQEKLEWKLQVSESTNVYNAEITPNGKYALLIGGSSLQILDIKNKNILWTLYNPGSSYIAKWSPDSEKILSTYGSHTDYTYLCIFDVKTGKQLYNFDKTVHGIDDNNPWSFDSKKLFFIEGNIPESFSPEFKVSSVLFN